MKYRSGSENWTHRLHWAKLYPGHVYLRSIPLHLLLSPRSLNNIGATFNKDLPKVDFLAREISDEVTCVYAENQKTDFEVQNGGLLIIDLNSISHAKRLAQTLFLVVSQSHAILLLYKEDCVTSPKRICVWGLMPTSSRYTHHPANDIFSGILHFQRLTVNHFL